MMVMQRAVRAFLKSRRQARQNAAALSIQKVWRGYKDRKLAKQLRMELAMQEQISAVKLLQVRVFYNIASLPLDIDHKERQFQQN